MSLGKVLSFGGTAYLGIPHNEEFLALVYEGMQRFGINHGASRNNNLSLSIYNDAEREISRRFSSEAALVVSSGYLAAQMVIQKLVVSHQLLYAPETHPALWIGTPAPPSIGFREWADLCVSACQISDKPLALITNSVNNLKPEIYDFAWLSSIPASREVTIVVDDSHGVGITGPGGKGVYNSLPKLPNIKIIVVASMAKALGVDAGFILGSKESISDLKKSPIFVGSSPPSPGFLYAWMKAEDIYDRQYRKLQQNIAYAEELIAGKENIIYVPGFPVILLQEGNAAELLRRNGIEISSFPYPNPQDRPLNRVVISSTHEFADLESLTAALQ